jgi:hypothetical protein
MASPEPSGVFPAGRRSRTRGVVASPESPLKFSRAGCVAAPASGSPGGTAKHYDRTSSWGRSTGRWLASPPSLQQRDSPPGGPKWGRPLRNQIELFPFRYPITFATEYFGWA